MHIGLIGGIGPAATDFYYRGLVGAFHARDAALEMTVVHADSRTLIANLERDAVAAQVAIYQCLTARLVEAGAERVVVTSIAGHFCIDAFAAASPLPVIDIRAAVRTAVEARGLTRIGILGTRPVMTSGFYGGLASVAVAPPLGDDLDAVHTAYVTMATTGRITAAHRAVFDDATARLLGEGGAEAVLLGGTDLALAYPDAAADPRFVDAAALHVAAIVEEALGAG